VEELIHGRNYYEGRMNVLAGENARQLFVSSAIENLRADFEKRGRESEWNEKYEVAYDRGRFEDFTKRYMDQYKPLEDMLNGLSNAWCAWARYLEGEKHKLSCLDARYHPSSGLDCINQARTIADMINGTGK